MWYGSKGILLAIRDEGDFFSRPETKKIFESKEFVPSTRVPPSGIGMENIYKADKVFVSTEENALYCAVIIIK